MLLLYTLGITFIDPTLISVIIVSRHKPRTRSSLMGISKLDQKIAGLKKSLEGIETSIKALGKENYPKDGPKYCSYELQRSRVAAQLAAAEEQQLNQAA